MGRGQNSEQDGVTLQATAKPDLNGRIARCACGKEEPSDWSLAFFEYRGPGSRSARESCANCGYYEVAHTDEVRGRNRFICAAFSPRGDSHDLFYCGCRGWD